MMLIKGAMIEDVGSTFELEEAGYVMTFYIELKTFLNLKMPMEDLIRGFPKESYTINVTDITEEIDTPLFTLTLK